MENQDLRPKTLQNLYNLVSTFGGATHLHVNRQIDNTEYDKTTQNALKSQYGYGDEQAKAQLDDIINGDTVLKFDAEGSEVAQSVILIIPREKHR